MAYWLIKTEPGSWSWQDQVEKGNEHWNGVRNYQASNYMKAMKLGDHAFFYHSVKEKSVVGIVEISREYYPDHTDESGRFGMVDVRTVKALNRPVSLAEIKAEKDLQEMALLKQSRLSVMPVTNAEWQIICKMGQTVPDV
ncbi:EVE domain-containing protein [Kiloniella laminariae]|uniref:EVE domain-containing protein n=1 Tax=Kiloniella laminariae TaxID=454162 RepID=A0ABT4LJ29_9PROT|nr:EVE domain-containing protein [Kiloniella laminariae]MCZ4281087.1 EVE domain-containing protein [Kiloniella laminariae]